MSVNRKYESIDILKLYAKGSTNGWNQMLTDCFNKKDINKLAKLKYQVSAGMTDLAKSKLNTDEINVWFARLVKSLEITAKKIIKVKHPMPGDYGLKGIKTSLDELEIKRKRDRELMKFFKDSGF